MCICTIFCIHCIHNWYVEGMQSPAIFTSSMQWGPTFVWGSQDVGLYRVGYIQYPMKITFTYHQYGTINIPMDIPSIYHQSPSITIKGHNIPSISPWKYPHCFHVYISDLFSTWAVCGRVHRTMRSLASWWRGISAGSCFSFFNGD